MNTEVLFSSKSEMWETPQDFFDKLDEELHFDLDVCATPDNAKRKRYFTPEMDGLSRPWEGVCWCNPPYCRQTGKWVRKARDEAGKGNCTVVMLLPCRPDVAWFHDYVLGEADLSMNVSEASRALWERLHRRKNGMTTPAQSTHIRMCCGRTKPICWQVM